MVNSINSTSPRSNHSATPGRVKQMTRPGWLEDCRKARGVRPFPKLSKRLSIWFLGDPHHHIVTACVCSMVAQRSISSETRSSISILWNIMHDKWLAFTDFALRFHILTRTLTRGSRYSQGSLIAYPKSRKSFMQMQYCDISELFCWQTNKQTLVKHNIPDKRIGCCCIKSSQLRECAKRVRHYKLFVWLAAVQWRHQARTCILHQWQQQKQQQ